VALTKIYNAPSKDIRRIQKYLVHPSTTIFKGGMVCLDANGLLIPCTPTDQSQFAGIAIESATAGASGNVYCTVARDGIFLLQGSGFDQTNVGDVVYAADDELLGGTADFSQKVGEIVEFDSLTKVWVDILDGVKNPEILPYSGP
jgi:predicted RecA/RadA family phage recombinase